MLLIVRLLAGVAALKVAGMLVAVWIRGVGPAPVTSGLAFGVAPTAFLATVLGVVGVALVALSRASVGAAAFGATQLLVAAAFSGGVARRVFLEGWPRVVVDATPVDVFLPYCWWVFLRDFTRSSTGPEPAVPAWATRVSGLVGLLLGSAMAAAALGVVPTAYLVSRQGPMYTVPVFGLTAAGFLWLYVRRRLVGPTDAERIRIFALGLFAGFGPILLDILVAAVSPAYDAWSWQPDIAAVRVPALFIMLAMTPLITAYSVLVDQVLDMRVVLRAAAQYSLARFTLLAIVVVPFAVLTAYLYSHRTVPLGALFTGGRVGLSLALIGVGLAALRLREQWLAALDRRYFRAEADSAAIVASFVERAQTAASPADLSRVVSSVVTSAVHAEHVSLLLADATRTALVEPEHRVRALSTSSGLALLLGGDSAPLDVSMAGPASLLARLPPAERTWLNEGRYELLVPLRRSATALAGVLALGPKLGGQRYHSRDLRLLNAVAGAALLAVENQRLKSSPSGDDDDAANECSVCGVLAPASSTTCSCGGSLVTAPVPLLLHGSFRFERRLGAGGMGVVYRATDEHLARAVAIKTLPSVSEARAGRLRQEARTMARFTHPNLATIHGVETWRGTPLVIVELLTGGTLATRLEAGALPWQEAIAIGVTLTGVLQYLHQADVVHCDIKPSNIGFTSSNTLKVLDFGLARLLAADDSPTLADRSRPDLASTRDSASEPGAGTGRIVGTLLYMSPEALLGQRPSPAFDLWSTAVVLYEALAGHHPFAGGAAEDAVARIRRGECQGAAALRQRVPPSCVDVLARSLSPDPAERPATAMAFRERIAALRPEPPPS